MFTRTETRKIRVGKVAVGGGAPVTIQSMTNTKTEDVSATVDQIKRLEDAGCEIVRVAVPDMKAALKLGAIKKRISIPLVADIHFDYRLAVEAASQGVDKLRLNPGNIGSRENVEKVVSAAKKACVPIRIGVNAGSLKAVHGKSGPLARAKSLVDSALEHVKILESFDFKDIAVSLKASDIATTVEAYRLMAQKRNYPLHLGITEAGTLFRGTVKSSAGLGIILYMGLGDTIRVSLTADPVEEIKVARQILQSLALSASGVELVSCPTCSRCEVDLIKITGELEDKISSLRPGKKGKDIKVAVMGCVVNGPGEAREADIGIAGGKNTGLLFENGKPVSKVAPDRWVKTLMGRINRKIKSNK